MDIKGEKIQIPQNAELSYEFLSRPQNYEELMPENVTKFELNDQGGFVFQLKGMPAIALKLEEKAPYQKVVWSSASDNFKFKLWAEITDIAEKQSEVQLLFHGDLNPMITMMAKKPLGKLIETLSANLKKNPF